MQKGRICLLLILVSLALFTSAQNYSVSGHIIDSATREPLAFVNILINDSQSGGMTDIDGHFQLHSYEPVKKLRISYVGYSAREYFVNGKGEHIIKLASRSYELQEVKIVAGENPAHRIIRNVLANRESNNPSNIRSYSYTSYDKMIFTAFKDTIHHKDQGNIDSTLNDTTDLKVQELLKKQHLFMMESVAEHKYLFPEKHYDKVIATKVSGLSDPLFVFLLSTSQPTSFYDENISIAGKNYLNPIASGFDRNYFFWISDTLINENGVDSTYIISFKPKAGKNFDGLKGLLYISTVKWAIANVIAEPSRTDDNFSIRIQQMYEYLEGNQWFPVQLNTDITFNNMSFGSRKPMAIGKSYRKDIKLKPELVKQEFNNVAVEVVPEASRRDDGFWDLYRSDSLTPVERNTYHIIDSLGKEHHLDRMTKLMTSLTSGRLPVGIIDVDLNRLYRYNLYEKSYLGLGLYTNSMLCRYFSVGGYAGYGFGDKDVKYGGSMLFTPLKYDKLKVKFSFQNDLEESAGTRFFDDAVSLFGDEGFRGFYVSQWEKVQSFEGIATLRTFKYLTLSTGIKSAHKKAMFDYGWAQTAGDIALITNEHDFGYYILGMKFAYGEKFVRNQYSQASLGTKYPILWLQYTLAQNGLLNSDFSYHRLDLKSTYSFYTKLAGRTSITINAGIIDHDVPHSELFNGKGSAGSGFTVYSSGNFTTMRPSEFISDRYAYVFMLHNFGKLLYRSNLFDPDIAVAISAGIGSLDKPLNHRYIDFKTMEKGYYETGVIVNNILRSSFSGIGAGVFYRLGPYSFPEVGKNLMFRLSLKYTI
ncbi:MAG TPA: DUF5686 family protein [Lentimicrobium sp.]|nr:DUF5686 family protein [Lentimicrobium sp.]